MLGEHIARVTRNTHVGMEDNSLCVRNRPFAKATAYSCHPPFSLGRVEGWENGKFWRCFARLCTRFFLG